MQEWRIALQCGGHNTDPYNEVSLLCAWLCESEIIKDCGGHNTQVYKKVSLSCYVSASDVPQQGGRNGSGI